MKYNTAEKNNELVHISKVNPLERGGYICIECGKPMIPKLGKINEHHFAHKSDTACSGESYLHKLGKRLFRENYVACLLEKRPFFLDYYKHQTCISCTNQPPLNTSCKFDNQIKSFDLTHTFDLIEEEGVHNGFTADILLSSSTLDDVLFIEIAVTHECELPKFNQVLGLWSINSKVKPRLTFSRRQAFL